MHVCVWRSECQQPERGQQVTHGIHMPALSVMGENRVHARCVGVNVSVCMLVNIKVDLLESRRRGLKARY